MGATTLTLTVSDPATAVAIAALQAFTAACNFLCTPAGQTVAKDIQATVDKIAALIPAQTPVKAA